MGTPAASAWSESPICKRAGGSSTCSVDVLVCEAVVRVLLCGDGSIGPLNLQRTIISGGGEGGWINGVLLTCRCKAICSEGLVVLGGGMCGFPWYMYM